MSQPNKTCTKCGINKPLERFYFIKRSQSFESRCKTCITAYVRARNAADGGKAIREVYERRKAKGWTQKRYKDKTPEEKALGYAALLRYRERNKERVNLEGRKSLQLRRSPAYQKAWPLILEHYGNKCLRCGATAKLCFDHVVPLASNGENSIINGQPLCIGCNTTKGQTDRERDWRPDQGAWIKELTRLNPWLGEAMPEGRWHLKPDGRDRLKRIRDEEKKELVMPGHIAQRDGDVVGFNERSAWTAGQIANQRLLDQLSASLANAPLDH